MLVLKMIAFTKVKRLKDKQWLVKHYTENLRLSISETTNLVYPNHTRITIKWVIQTWLNNTGSGEQYRFRWTIQAQVSNTVLVE
jgi:hypothetical protein